MICCRSVVFSNKTDRSDITEILKVALNTVALTHVNGYWTAILINDEIYCTAVYAKSHQVEWRVFVIQRNNA